jgi:ribonucleoside-diphosphate reductase alpha chain
MKTDMKLEFSPFAETIRLQKYAHKLPGGDKETWGDTAQRVSSHVLGAIGASGETIDQVTGLIARRVFIPGGRYLYSTGREFHQTQNCLLLRVEDTREGWADLLHKVAMSLMTGAGIGVVYTAIRPEGEPVRRTGGVSTGPLALCKMVNECGRGIMQGGARRSAIWAGLHWNHNDVMKFIRMKDWPEHIKQAKSKDFNAYAPMDGTNISVILDTEFFKAFGDKTHPQNQLAVAVYWATVQKMVETGEPGFSIDAFENEGENCRNACTEITSYDDSDICNLGSVNLARVSSLYEMEEAVRLGTLFLLAGTVYSDVPYGKVDEIRTKNRRLGLGLMGIHEWLLLKGEQYGPSEKLKPYLEIYASSTRISKEYADRLGLSAPVKTRAIAPTGTIGIIGETTQGCEPIFCVAYKRRYFDYGVWKYQYVVDPTAQRLIENGVDSEDIEDAYTLAKQVERRIAFQAWLQQYVDHGISSTINLPSFGEPPNTLDKIEEFGNILMKYLPKLRGITVYPEGSRSGQPITPVKYTTAAAHPGQVFYESVDVCDFTGGNCGS